MSELVHELRTPQGHSIQVRKGDLTAETTDAIVNAANGQLAHGGGVAAAISRRGGPAIDRESRAGVSEYGSVSEGGVAVTGAGQLEASWVIHAVGPVWHGGERGEEAALRNAVKNSLKKADEMGLASLALPAISSGIFGFPKNRCAAIFRSTIEEFCDERPDSKLREIRLTNIDQETVSIFERELRRAQD